MFARLFSWLEWSEKDLDRVYWGLCSFTKKTVWQQGKTESQNKGREGWRGRERWHIHIRTVGRLGNKRQSGPPHGDATQSCSIRFQQHLPQTQYRGEGPLLIAISQSGREIRLLLYIKTIKYVCFLSFPSSSLLFFITLSSCWLSKGKYRYIKNYTQFSMMVMIFCDFFDSRSMERLF